MHRITVYKTCQNREVLVAIRGVFAWHKNMIEDCLQNLSLNEDAPVYGEQGSGKLKFSSYLSKHLVLF